MMMSLFLAGSSLLSFNTGFAIWILISLIVFLGIMYKFALPPIIKGIEERETSIQSSLDAAEKALRDAEKIAKDNEDVVREAERAAQKIRKEATKEVEEFRAERLEKAKEDAEKLIEDAKKSIDQEKQKALNELRKEVADLTIEATTRLLQKNVDSETNRKLIDETINDLSKN